ncbi:MAG: MATE family efflux transporter [Parasporobacterium sp.]|nr:MATE family efflux transporter [Parasporobacterium sp.]
MKQNMITGNPARSLIAFVLPLILGNMFQQFYSLADSMIVGKTLGQDCLAAVGSTSSICLVYVSIANGLGIGCSVVISQLFGARDYVKMKTAFNTAFTAIAGFTILALGIGVITGNGLIELTNIPQHIVGDARSYYFIYVAGFPGLFFYNIANSGFNALGKSRMPLLFLLLSSVLNIGLDLWFILGFHWGVAGAAIATIISQYLAAVLSFVLLLRYIRKNFRTEEKPQLFNSGILKTMGKVAVPSMITQSVVSVGFVALQSLVNGFGTDVMAGFVAACKIDGIAVIPVVQAGNAMSTFTAQNIGAGKIERVTKGFRAILAIDVVICVAFFLILQFFKEPFVGLFMDASASENAIRFGCDYLTIMACFYVVFGIMNSISGILRGAGDAVPAMISTLLNFGSRIAFAYIMVALGGNEMIIAWSNAVGWGVGLIISLTRFLTGKWKKKNLVAAQES